MRQKCVIKQREVTDKLQFRAIWNPPYFSRSYLSHKDFRKYNLGYLGTPRTFLGHTLSIKDFHKYSILGKITDFSQLRNLPSPRHGVVWHSF